MTSTFEADQAWFHGSPYELTTLHPGSTITQRRDLARIFSHKPSLVSVSDSGQIKHNGLKRGYLYIISTDIKVTDVRPHPETTMSPGDEWLTTRELSVALVCLTELVPQEQLTQAELIALQKRLKEQE